MRHVRFLLWSGVAVILSGVPSALAKTALQAEPASGTSPADAAVGAKSAPSTPPAPLAPSSPAHLPADGGLNNDAAISPSADLQAPTPATAHPEIEALRAALRKTLAKPAMAHARISVLVNPLSHADFAHFTHEPMPGPYAPPLFEHNADLGLNAASNVKLVTASAALSLLGPAYQWRTSVYAAATPRRAWLPQKQRDLPRTALHPHHWGPRSGRPKPALHGRTPARPGGKRH